MLSSPSHAVERAMITSRTKHFCGKPCVRTGLKPETEARLKISSPGLPPAVAQGDGDQEGVIAAASDAIDRLRRRLLLSQ